MAALKRLAENMFSRLSLTSQEERDCSPSTSPRRKQSRLAWLMKGSLFTASSENAYNVTDRSALSNPLEDILSAELLTDMVVNLYSNNVLVCQMPAHQAILASQSLYFRSRIIIALDECRDEVEISLHDFSEYAFQITIGFLYSGRVFLQDDTVIDVYVLADLLQLNELKEFCEIHIQEAISCESLKYLLEEARQRNTLSIENQLVHFFQNNVNTAIESDSLVGISEELLIALLCKDFWVDDEMKVFDFVLRWGRCRLREMCLTRKHTPTLQSVLSNVIKYVRLISISKENLESKVVPSRSVDEDIIIEILFHQLQFGIPEPPEDIVDSPNSRDKNGRPIKFYLRPRKGHWMTLRDFEDEDAYAAYLRKTLVPGMVIRAVNTFEQIHSGDIGEFVQHNEGVPPCQVRWQKYGNTYWLFWRDIEIAS